MIKYEMIRGPEQKKRCKEDGEKLYCDCGCQNPNYDEDPEIDLEGVTVVGKTKTGYAEYKLMKDDKVVGYYNTQWTSLTLNGREYFGCNREGLAPLNDQIFNDNGVSKFKTENTIITAGDTFEETASNEATAEKWQEEDRDEEYKSHPGYCDKCHDFCYGECG